MRQLYNTSLRINILFNSLYWIGFNNSTPLFLVIINSPCFFFNFSNKLIYFFCAFGWIRQFHLHKSIILFDAFFGALWAQDVGPIGDESFADQRSAATGALEAVVMPMAILERDESCAADSCSIIWGLINQSIVCKYKCI